MQLTKHWAALLDDYVIDLAWSPDGSLLAAASATGPVSLFAATDGVRLHELPGHENGTNCIAWAPLAPPALKEKGRMKKEEVVQPLAGSDPASSIFPLPSSLLLATGGQDGAVKFWDASAGQHTATAGLGTAWVEHLGWRSAGDSPASGKETTGTPAVAKSTADKPALLLAAAGKNLSALRPDGSVVHVFKPAPKTISALAWQPAGGCAGGGECGKCGIGRRGSARDAVSVPLNSGTDLNCRGVIGFAHEKEHSAGTSFWYIRVSDPLDRE